MEEFFLTCPIGLEKYLKLEVQYKWELIYKDAPLQIELAKGGLTIFCTLEQGFSLNHFIRGTSKILWRLKCQKCRDIPKLYNIIRKFPWKNYLNQHELDFKISAKKSRLIHTEKIKKAANEALADYFEANKIKESTLLKHAKDPKQIIMLRLYEDELTISLDTSGELLHIRGDAEFRGHASLRENIATLLLWILMQKLPKKRYLLLDPMCGTGTFLKEAVRQFIPLERTFQYQFLSKDLLSELRWEQQSFHNWDLAYLGRDKDGKILDKWRLDAIPCEQADVFSAPKLSYNLPKLVIVNPPYGKRIKIAGDKKQYFSRLYHHLIADLDPQRLLMIIPTPFEKGLKGEKLYFKQNGINVCCLLYNRS